MQGWTDKITIPLAVTVVGGVIYSVIILKYDRATQPKEPVKVTIDPPVKVTIDQPVKVTIDQPAPGGGRSKGGTKALGDHGPPANIAEGFVEGPENAHASTDGVPGAGVNGSVVVRPPDPRESAAIRADLEYYDQKLQIDPGDLQIALRYARESLPRIIALGDAGIACESLEHWRNYASAACSLIHRDVLYTVRSKLPGLRALCPRSALDDRVLMRCADQARP